MLLTATAPLAAAPPAGAQESTVQCDGQWHFEPDGEPVFKREVADEFTLDNRDGTVPMERTVRTKEALSRSYTRQADLGLSTGAEAGAGFRAFSAGLQAALGADHGFSVTESNAIEKETELRLTAGPGVGYIRYVGLESVQVTGAYERILDCDKRTRRYQRIGPVTEEAPLRGKAVWTETLPNSK
ncbi:hypothetical protein ACFQ2M_00335 [Kitasatospora saccharophila]|uniref:hypothetical protein n=1 Tax=Kitasatospora saccharophila TaxID=407973 RepID=UPI00364154F4